MGKAYKNSNVIMSSKVKLGVNIDHVATLRNARGEAYPSVLKAAQIVEAAGGDGITVHLREDRRHIRDADVFEIRKNVKLPLNLELAATEEMLRIALQVKPNACCIVPERRQELTTEGGLDVENNFKHLSDFAKALKGAGILTSLFINADEKAVEYAAKIGADIVEFHTGAYCHNVNIREAELKKITKAAKLADQAGIICHAGHGLTYETVPAIIAIKEIKELNIGHFLIAESLFDGLPNVIKKMKRIMNGEKI